MVRGGLTPQAAFFEQRIEIAGDVEKGLKLAVLFGHFVQRIPLRPPEPEERGMPPLCPPDALVVESVRFAAGPYRLEGELAYAERPPAAGAVVLAGPHPLLGGNMDNNVVRGLGDGLARRGFADAALQLPRRRRQRGPGRWTRRRTWPSSGQTSHVPDEPALPGRPGRRGGGLPPAVGGRAPALVGLQLRLLAAPARRSRRADDLPLVLIAPTVGTHDYDAFDGLPNPQLVVAPDDDFAADPRTAAAPGSTGLRAAAGGWSRPGATGTSSAATRTGWPRRWPRIPGRAREGRRMAD